MVCGLKFCVVSAGKNLASAQHFDYYKSPPQWKKDRLRPQSKIYKNKREPYFWPEKRKNQK